MQIELQELMEQAGNRPTTTPFEIGKCYLIRTVTNYSVGRMKETAVIYLVHHAIVPFWESVYFRV